MAQGSFSIPFPDLAGPLTRDELHQRMATNPELVPLGGEQEIGGQLFVTFVQRNPDRRVLALFFGPDAQDPDRWVLTGWVPVPVPGSAA